MTIRELGADECLARVDGLCDLLIDAVESGASIGFLAPLARAEAEAFWRGEVAGGLKDGSRRLLAAFEGARIVGTIQLALSLRPNAAHRAEVMKLFVHSTARGRGLATALLAETEALAQRLGRRLLILDTREGDEAERLYRKLGYETSGLIPDYALSARGELHATVIMYKRLGNAAR